LRRRWCDRTALKSDFQPSHWDRDKLDPGRLTMSFGAPSLHEARAHGPRSTGFDLEMECRALRSALIVDADALPHHVSASDVGVVFAAPKSRSVFKVVLGEAGNPARAGDLRRTPFAERRLVGEDGAVARCAGSPHATAS
jgi:hypothetical protein